MAGVLHQLREQTRVGKRGGQISGGQRKLLDRLAPDADRLVLLR
eukprot:gene19852-50549_t